MGAQHAVSALSPAAGLIDPLPDLYHIKCCIAYHLCIFWLELTAPCGYLDGYADTSLL